MTTVFRAARPPSGNNLFWQSRGCGVNRSSATTTTTASSAFTRRTFTSLNQDTPFQLCFLRHGQSTWNRDNRFIGWTDTPLTDQGVLEAKIAGQMLAQSRIQFDEVHTSLLRRSIRTTNIALMELQQEYIPVHKSWRLNERNYGDLVGQHKKECVQRWGVDQVKRWRRSYDEPPPPMRPDHPHHPARDPRYRNVRIAYCCVYYYSLCSVVLCELLERNWCLFSWESTVALRVEKLNFFSSISLFLFLYITIADPPQDSPIGVAQVHAGPDESLLGPGPGAGTARGQDAARGRAREQSALPHHAPREHLAARYHQFVAAPRRPIGVPIGRAHAATRQCASRQPPRRGHGLFAGRVAGRRRGRGGNIGARSQASVRRENDRKSRKGRH